MSYTLGENVKYYRNQLGFTQEALAEAVGVSTDFIKQIERNRERPSIENFAKLCKALKIPADFLLTSDKHFKCTSLLLMLSELTEKDDAELNNFISLTKKYREHIMEVDFENSLPTLEEPKK